MACAPRRCLESSSALSRWPRCGSCCLIFPRLFNDQTLSGRRSRSARTACWAASIEFDPVLPHRLPTLVRNSSTREDTAIPFDYLGGPDIVFFTCNSNTTDALFTKHGQGESQQLRSIPKASHRRANVVSNVSTLLL